MKYEKYKDLYTQFLISEKNLSRNSVNNYLVDLDQFFHTEDIKVSDLNTKIKSYISNLRKKRGDISKYIQKIEQIASTDENLMPHIIEAVSNKVTIGEVCNSLRKVWGEYRPKEIL